MGDDRILISGAREHNLRDVDLALPRNRLIVVTGVSGSGKSSLAFDTLYAEGQRRYIESLSTAARQYVGQMHRPDVDRIEGLSPAIAIQQKATDANPRSTVATVTEIYDYLRVFFARLGTIECCGQAVGRQTPSEIIDRIMGVEEDSKIQVLAPVVRQRKGWFQDVFEDARKAGFVRVRVDGEVLDLSQSINLDRNRRHDIEIVVDRLVVKPDVRGRLADSVELALTHGDGALVVNVIPPDGEPRDLLFSRDLACPVCGTSYLEPSPPLFSFNSLQGMCPACQGLGVRPALDLERILPDPTLSIAGGAIAPWGKLKLRRHRSLAESLAKHFRFSLDTPWQELSERVRQVILYGSPENIRFEYVSGRGRRIFWNGTYEGVMSTLSGSDKDDDDNGNGRHFVRSAPCPDCHGQRLRHEARVVKVDGINISELCALTIQDSAAWFDDLALAGQRALIGEDLVREIRGRLNFLLDVGLHYLTLDRSAPTLSGGEGQRIRLASQIGAGLVGVTYVLDEPSIGLHHRDNRHLLATLRRLRDMGNTVVVVEHDEETMRAADYLVDVGPGAGRHGGEIVAAGEPADVAATETSLTAAYLTGRRRIDVPAERRTPDPERKLVLRGARENNLRDLDVELPLGLFLCVTGVSGSGKSSLINDTLYPALARALNGAEAVPGEHDALEGLEQLDKVINIDQSPIGRTPRSNPATYTKALDPIRALFAQLPESKVRAYAPGRFSFNVAGGRCDACEGLGYVRVEMDFLEDVWVECDVCDGRRFNQDTLNVRFKGRNIADVLAMTVNEAIEHFGDVPKIVRVLKTMADVGLGYLQLGQPAPTLSGGEAQRIKLARELARRSTGRTFYLLDEPTTGLHFEDIAKLLAVLGRLVDEGNTVLVIEHNLDVVKTADWVIDLGPEGGAAGGRIVATGTPEALVQVPGSYTGQSLREVLAETPPPLAEPNGDGPTAATASPWAPLDEVVVQGARAHNLKDLDAAIPRGKLTTFTGVSGSGKSSLALDTIYAEGQRRYVESLSTYARQFIHQLEKPPVDFVSGLSPAISIEQRAGSRNPRSTVGTVTEIHDYLRLLWSRLGVRHCVVDGALVGRQTVDDIVGRVMLLPEGTRITILAPLVLGRNESWAEAFERLRREGFLRVRIDGTVVLLEDDAISIDRRRQHTVEIVIDRVSVRPEQRSRVGEAVELALERGEGQMLVHVDEGHPEAPGVQAGDILFSRRWTCSQCGRAYEDLEPQHFSFNSPLGWCETCEGIGYAPGVDPDLVLAHPERTLKEGAVQGLDILLRRRPFRVAFEALSQHWPVDRPLEEWAPEQVAELLLGSETPIDFVTDRQARTTITFPGVTGELARLYELGQYREEIGALRRDVPCPECGGARVREDAAAVRFRGHTLREIGDMPLRDVREVFDEVELRSREEPVGAEPLREVRRRLAFLVDIGLGYLTLGRASGSLSGGESQRIRLASQIGSGLTGVLYILDEPTIGLHPRDNRRLLDALHRLRDLGNTVIMVEHDAEAIRTSDHVLDFGPGAGVHGGRIVAAGSPEAIAANDESLTGDYLSGRRRIPLPGQRRLGNGHELVVQGARHHNLRNLDVAFPLATLTVVTGVSGSGKSSLVNDIVYPALARELHRARQPVGAHDRIEGLRFLDKVINIDQRPIGDNPRSNPASYVGVFDLIRELFAQLPEARARGYTESRFSFNRPGGRCELCWGYGSRKIEMHFLADVWVPCDECHGKRYNAETLQIEYKNKTIADVLDMTIGEALQHFRDVPRIKRMLKTLDDVGLDYLQLGQSALTLSGGEAQRVKLARELSRPSTGQTLYLLDEPTTGLHFDDVRKLLEVLDRLVDEGNTVLVIEHNLEVIRHADHVIDLGPEGGDGGGRLVTAGTPEEVAEHPTSHTAAALRDELDPDREVALARTEVELDVIENPHERWHRRQMAFSQDRDAAWSGDDLMRLIAELRSLGGEVGEPDWRNNEFVTLGVDGIRRWWVRIRTSKPDALRLIVRTAPKAMREALVAERAGLRPRPGADAPRVALKRRKDEDEIWFELVDPGEFTSDAFRELLADLLHAFEENRL